MDVDTIRIALLVFMVVIVVAFMAYIVRNIEAIKTDPLAYASEKIRGNCQCFCMDTKYLVEDEMLKPPIPQENP